jgi:hypothetical protein
MNEREILLGLMLDATHRAIDIIAKAPLVPQQPEEPSKKPLSLQMGSK